MISSGPESEACNTKTNISLFSAKQFALPRLTALADRESDVSYVPSIYLGLYRIILIIGFTSKTCLNFKGFRFWARGCPAKDAWL